MKWISLMALLPMASMALPLRPGVNFRVQIPGEYIVKANGEESVLNIKRKLGKDLYLVEADKNSIAAQNGNPNYAYYGEYMESTPSDELFGEQYHHQMIMTERAWEITKGDKEIIVAVTDNEFDMGHADLEGQWWINEGEIADNGIDDDGNGYIDDVSGWDFVGEDNSPDFNAATHGTHVSGIIAAKANNQIGGAGIAPNVKIMPLRWYGTERRWTSALVAETYHYAIDNGAKIINTSYNIDGLVEDQVYLDAIQYAKENEVLVFNSAGNSDKKDPPRQAVEDVILVCSVVSKEGGWFKKPDQKSSFSNYGSGVDICAPGDPILASVRTRGTHNHGELQGTSMASPVAAAVAALIWSHNPNFSAAEVRQRLLDSADNIDEVNKKKFHGLLGAGRVNAYEALK